MSSFNVSEFDLLREVNGRYPAPDDEGRDEPEVCPRCQAWPCRCWDYGEPVGRERWLDSGLQLAVFGLIYVGLVGAICWVGTLLGAK